MPCQAWRPVGVSPSFCLRHPGPVQEQSVRLVLCLVSIPPPIFSLSPARTSGRGSQCAPPATQWDTVDLVAERLLDLGIKWSVVCWCSGGARPGLIGRGSLLGPVFGLMQRDGTRGTGSTALNPGPSGICLTVSDQTLSKIHEQMLCRLQ